MCQISRGRVWRIKKEGLLGNRDCQEHIRRGRPVKLSARDGRQLVRALQRLREKEGNFSCQRIMQEESISAKDVLQGFATNRLQNSFNKFVNRHGFIVEKYGAALWLMRLAIQA